MTSEQEGNTVKSEENTGQNNSGLKTLQIGKKERIENNVFIIVFLPIIFLMVTLLVSFPLAIQSMTTGDMNMAAALISTAIAELIAVAIYIMYSKNKIPLDWKKKLGFQNFSWKWFTLSLVIGLLTFVLLQVVQIFLVSGLGLDISSSETSLGAFETTGITRYLTIFFLVPIVAPLVEEILFRGAIFNGLLLGKMPVFWSFIIGAFAFAIMHLQGVSTFTDFFTVAWIFVVALINCAVFYKTRSIYNTMAIHLVYNSVTVIAAVALMAV